MTSATRRRQASGVVFAVGVMLTILGHVASNPEVYPWAVDIFAPAYGRALRAYEEMLVTGDMDAKEPAILKAGSPGFKEIFRIVSRDFRELPRDPSAVKHIAIQVIGLAIGSYSPTTAAYYSGIQTKVEIALKDGRIVSKPLNDLRPEIRKQFLEDQVMWLGTIAFWGGIVVGLLSRFM